MAKEQEVKDLEAQLEALKESSGYLERGALDSFETAEIQRLVSENQFLQGRIRRLQG